MQAIRSLILIIVIVGGLFFANSNTLAQTGVVLTVSPLRFELTANPGDSLVNKLRVFNGGNSTVSIKMETEDFRAVGEAGEVVVAPEEELVYSLKRWVAIAPTELTLEPNEQKFIDFAISVPENAEPGGKYGSILASITGSVGEGSGTGIAQKVGSLVLLTVAGNVKEDLFVKEFSVPDFSEYGPIKFEMKFENKGSVHVRPKGFITISDWRGKKAGDIEFPQSNVIPGATRKIEAVWQEKVLIGRYTATLVGSYGASNTPIDPLVITFWVFPWKVGLAVLAGILLVLLILYLTRKRLRLAAKVLLRGEKSI